jgi:hypothetical protein
MSSRPPTPPKLPWRRRKDERITSGRKNSWWAKLWASRSAWTVVGGGVVFVLTHGVESLTNVRKLPAEALQTYHSFQSWYYDDAAWTGTWSSREEGDVQDYHQAEMPLKLSASTERGEVFGEMFNRSVCELSPMLPPVLVEGKIQSGKLRAFAFAYVGGQKELLYSFEATRSEAEPVITLTPINDPNGLMPQSARLVHRNGVTDQQQAAGDADHPELVCPESSIEYIQRMRKEGVLQGAAGRLKEGAASPAKEPTSGQREPRLSPDSGK